MNGIGSTWQGGWRRAALLLIACALLLKVPAGWMPQASAAGVSLGWCSGTMSHAVPEEARALLVQALGEHEKPAKPRPDQPCAFAAAAQPLMAADPAPLLLAPAKTEAPVFAPFALVPGRGLAAPPPRATGPPALA